MSVSFYIVNSAMMAELDALIDLMEEEDPLEENPDSAYDRFASRLQANHIVCLALTEEQSGPAEAFYEWYHDRVNEDLDKLYLTPKEAARAMGALEKLTAKQGEEKLVRGFWSPSDEYTEAEARAYLGFARQALALSVQHNGLMVICHH